MLSALPTLHYLQNSDIIVFMELYDWSDIDQTPHYLRDVNDAYSLPIIVNVERGIEYSDTDAYKAVVQLMVNLFDSGKWENTLKLWMKGRIRKVVRKARGSAWVNISQNMDTVTANQGNVTMVACEPHRLDELDSLLKKQQVQGINFTPAVTQNKVETGFNIAVNPILEMSSGKTLAQVAHVAQIAILEEPKERLKQWVDLGCPVNVVNWDVIPYGSHQIRDAGLTEIPAGSYTTRGFLQL